MSLPSGKGLLRCPGCRPARRSRSRTCLPSRPTTRLPPRSRLSTPGLGAARAIYSSPWRTKMRRTTTTTASSSSPTRIDHSLTKTSAPNRVTTSPAFRARERIWDRVSWVCWSRAIPGGLTIQPGVGSPPTSTCSIRPDLLKRRIVTTVLSSQISLQATRQSCRRVIRICWTSSCTRPSTSCRNPSRIKPCCSRKCPPRSFWAMTWTTSKTERK